MIGLLLLLLNAVLGDVSCNDKSSTIYITKKIPTAHKLKNCLKLVTGNEKIYDQYLTVEQKDDYQRIEGYISTSACLHPKTIHVGPGVVYETPKTKREKKFYKAQNRANTKKLSEAIIGALLEGYEEKINSSFNFMPDLDRYKLSIFYMGKDRQVKNAKLGKLNGMANIEHNQNLRAKAKRSFNYLKAKRSLNQIINKNRGNTFVLCYEETEAD